MSWIDLVIIIILAGCLIEGFLRGLIKELIGVVSVALGIYIARLYGDDMSIWLKEWEIPAGIADALAYALVFAAISAAVSFAAHVLSELVQMARLSTLNRIFGGVAGLVKGLIVVLIVVFGISKIDQYKPVLSPKTRAASKLYEPMEKLAHDCLYITRSQFGDERTDD